MPESSAEVCHVTCVEYLHAVSQVYTAAAESMRREARAMLSAVLADFSSIPHVRLTTLLGPGRSVPTAASRFNDSIPDDCSEFHDDLQNDEWPRIQVLTTRDENGLLEQLAIAARSGHALLIIAPESDGILARLLRQVEEYAVSGTQLLNVDSAWAAVYGDKLQTAAWLSQAGLPTIPAIPMSAEQPPAELPWECDEIVVKPRGSAGCDGVRVFRTDDSSGRQGWMAAHPDIGHWIAQPFLTGTACSFGFLGTGIAGTAVPLPVAVQRIERQQDGRLQYRGGAICRPHAEFIPQSADKLHSLGRPPSAERQMQAPVSISERCGDSGTFWKSLLTLDAARVVAECQAELQTRLPGFRGYLGVDVLVTQEMVPRALIVEINPRLCTTYVGYRCISLTNLAEQMLACAPGFRVSWSTAPVSFDEFGVVRQARTSNDTIRSC